MTALAVTAASLLGACSTNDVGQVPAPMADIGVIALDVPAVDVPAVDVPAVDVPAVDVPAVDVPAVDVPAVDVPTVEDIADAEMDTGSTLVEDASVDVPDAPADAGDLADSPDVVMPACPDPSQQLCDGTCRNVATDREHCGACGTACEASRRCVRGMCVPVGQRSCDPVIAGCGLVRIEGGTFTMGEPLAGHEVTPVQVDLHVDSFELDAYEVTLARFNAFWAVRDRDLAAIRSAPIQYPGGQVIQWTGMGEVPTPEDDRFNWSSGPGPRDNHPMNGVDWWAAQEFCVWDGGRLPTEAEWEFAARGRTAGGLSAPRVYAWGDAAPRGSRTTACDRAQWAFCAGEDGASTRRVGRFPPAAGLYDLTGNVWEWTADTFAPYMSPTCWGGRPPPNPMCAEPEIDEHTVRGGGWDCGTISMRATTRVGVASHTHYMDTGIRCARTVNP